ncbi:MAG: LLM class F420-dependent oxidoreductase [Acidimicrobiia bacterium]
MELGAVFPQIELGGDPEAAWAFAEGVADLGFDHLLAYDHVLGAVHADRTPPLTGPYTERDPFHDPFVLFAYLAGRLERLRFVTGVIVLPQRQTALVARQAADLDLFSGGRLTLGVGIGWNHVEYRALGQDFSRRGRRMGEQIELLRRLWTEPVVDFEGGFDHVERAATLPLPRRPIPIWCGGWSDAAYRRAARLADGFLFSHNRGAAEGWARMRAALDEAGRSPEGFDAGLTLRADTAGEAAERAHAWAEEGGTHLSVITMQHGFDSVQAHLDHLAEFAEGVGLRPKG